MAALNIEQVLNMGTVVQLNGSNFKKWRGDIELSFLNQGIDWIFTTPEPMLVEDPTDEQSESQRKWARANKQCILTIKKTLSDTMRGAIPNMANAVDYLQCITDKFQTNAKIESSMLMDKLHTTKFNMNMNMREHILQMISISAQLSDLGMPLDDGYMVYQVLNSLPAQFDGLSLAYHTQTDKWTLNQLIAVCVQEHERLKKTKPTVVNLVTKPQWKNKKAGGQYKPNLHKKPKNLKGKGNAENKNFQCYFCKRPGHLKRDCNVFKNWRAKQGVPKQQGQGAKKK